MVTNKHGSAIDWLASQRAPMIALLEQLVNTDSNSYDKGGVDAVGVHIKNFLSQFEIRCTATPIEPFGDALIAEVGRRANRSVLLMGHRDTVFPTGETKRRPFRVDGTRGYGPGVMDMKAGLVMNCFVLAALKTLGDAAPAVTALFTGDEEISSPSSRPLIEAHARNASAVFNSEPGRANGAVVTGRKGGVFMRIDVRGKAAHSGGNFEQGISAINELAHKILALSTLVDTEKGVTLNIGVVSGGEVVNMVAPRAHAEVDLRFRTPQDRDAALKEIEAIVAKPFVPGTSATLAITGEFVPLVQTAAGDELYRHYAGCAAELGFEAPAEFTGGCADSGFAAATGVPTLCGVGPVGGLAHSPNEYVELESLVPRAQALFLAIVRLGQ